MAEEVANSEHSIPLPGQKGSASAKATADKKGEGGFEGEMTVEYTFEHVEPETEEQKELLEWLGDGYDPERFDLEAVNRQLTGRR